MVGRDNMDMDMDIDYKYQNFMKEVLLWLFKLLFIY
jgi:hypothetical protein